VTPVVLPPDDPLPLLEPHAAAPTVSNVAHVMTPSIRTVDDRLISAP